MNPLDLVFAGLGFWSGIRSLKRAFEDDREATRGPRVRRVNLGDQMHDVHSIDERVGHIIRLIQKGRSDPKVIGLARQVISKRCGEDWCIAERDYKGEVRAIFAEVRRRVRYVRDEWGADTFSAPGKTLAWAGGDCDDYTIVLGSLLQAIGYPVKLRVIRTTDSPEWNHIYLVVGIPPGGPTQWVPLDASVNKPAGWEAPRDMIAAVRDYIVR